MARLVADEGEFQRIHRDDFLLLYLATFPAMFITAAGIVIPVQDANPGLLAILVGPPWAIVAVTLLGAMRHARFFADSEAFCPNLLPPWMVLRGIRSIHYDEIAECRHECGPGGWRFAFYLRNGRNVSFRYFAVRSGIRREVPKEAYDFILDHLLRRGIPTRPFEEAAAIPQGS